MPSYLQIEHISKSYGPKILFEDIGFNINQGDKIALIAPNGTGKTSLLRIIAGKEKSDSGGRITFLKDIRIAFLEQDYDYDPDKGILDQILSAAADFLEGTDADGAFQFELRVRRLLTGFGMDDLSKQMKQLSGGEVKRVALAGMLATEADFFIMDEPTNHLDIDAIEFLENWLGTSKSTLLMVTHDRYFLERTCNTIIELDHGNLYLYRGDYENYLEKRQERIENYNAETDKVRNILRRELEWMRSTPCARTGKAKYRKDAFYELKDRAEQVYKSSQVDMSGLGTGSRLGTKIINCKDVSFYYGNKCYLSHFTYNFQRYERVGVVGRNGAGKTTFLNLLTGTMFPDDPGEVTGVIDRGESLRIGYYRQSGMQFDEGQTVMETLGDTRLLGQFLFRPDMWNNKVSTLSGGEKRRLYLLTILQQQPNLLILDEPTNDLDIVTLNILEEYLQEYKGSLIIVSHDRHFLDRLVDHLLIIGEDGQVKDFIGSYTGYRTYLKDMQAEKKAAEKSAEKASAKDTRRRPDEGKKKLSFKEKRELETLESDLENLQKEKAGLEAQLSQGDLSFEALQTATARFAAVSELIDEKEMRWLELSELQ